MTETGFMNLTEFSQGSGLIDDIDGLVSKCRFGVWEYDIKNGERAGQKGRKFCVIGEIVSEGEEKPSIQYYGIGNPDNYEAIEDGRRCKPKGKATQLNVKSGAGQLLSAVLNVETDEKVREALGRGDVSVLEGRSYHFNRMADADNKNMTILLPTRTAGAPASSAAKQEVSADPAFVASVVTAAKEILGANSGTMEVAALSKAVFKKVPKKDALDLFKNDAFLDQHFAYDAGTKTVTAV